METKKCTCCGMEKPITEFKNIGIKDGKVGVLSICSDCMRQKQDRGRQMAKVEKQQKIAKEVAYARQMRLQDFTPRELMEELKRRGYTGKLQVQRIEIIDISDF